MPSRIPAPVARIAHSCFRARHHGLPLRRPTLMAVLTVYDREFGMLRLMLASPAGAAVVLAGRASATAGGDCSRGSSSSRQTISSRTITRVSLPGGTRLSLVAFAGVGAARLLLVAARLRSVENFAGIINVLLFPMMFISGALYPAGGLPRRCCGGSRGEPCDPHGRAVHVWRWAAHRPHAVRPISLRWFLPLDDVSLLVVVSSSIPSSGSPGGRTVTLLA